MSNYLLERMEKLDRDIAKEEKALVIMQKDIGRKMSKLSDLKKERQSASETYRLENRTASDVSNQVIANNKL